MNRKQFLTGLGASTLGLVGLRSRAGIPSDKPTGESARMPATGEVGCLPRAVPDLPITPFDAPAGSWTLVALPDTQHYSAFYADVYYRQGEWIAKHAKSHNIKFVLHEGDITDNNGAQQWTVAKAAMSQISGGGVPYVLVTGNHDIDQTPSPAGTRTAGRTLPRDRNTGHINRYFTGADYRNSPKWGALDPGHVENSWHEIDTPNGRVLIIGLEFGVSDRALAWGKKISEERPHDLLVFLTHAYLNADGRRYNYDTGDELQKRQSPKYYPLPDVNDGENIWQKWLINHKPGKLVICGHAAGRGGAYLRSENNVGTVCHQIFANYQIAVRPDKGFGGGGFMRLMQFLPDKRTVRVRTYSPYYNLWLDDSGQEFQIDLG